jgi:hypothetical protein
VHAFMLHRNAGASGFGSRVELLVE